MNFPELTASHGASKRRQRNPFITALQRLCNGSATALPQLYYRLYIVAHTIVCTTGSTSSLRTALHNLYERLYERLCNGSATALRRPCNGSTTALQRLYKWLYKGSTNGSITALQWLYKWSTCLAEPVFLSF